MRSNIIFLYWGILVHFLFCDHRNETIFLEHLSKCNFRGKKVLIGLNLKASQPIIGKKV